MLNALSLEQVAWGLKVTHDPSGKHRPVGLDRCPWSGCLVAHYKDVPLQDRLRPGNFWHISVSLGRCQDIYFDRQTGRFDSERTI